MPDMPASGAVALAKLAKLLPAALCVLPVPPEVAEVAEDGRVRIETAEPTRTLLALTRWAGDAGVELPNLTVSRATLEDIYLQLVDASEAVGAAE